MPVSSLSPTGMWTHMSVPHHPVISLPRGRINTSYGDLDLMTQLVSLGTWMYIFKFGDVDDTPS